MTSWVTALNQKFQQWIGVPPQAFDANFLTEMAVLVLLGSFILWRLGQFKAFKPFIALLLLYLGAFITARALDFRNIAHLMEAGFWVGMLGLVVVFQPELRRFLLTNNQSLLSRSSGTSSIDDPFDKTYIAKELMEAVRVFSKKKIGALIVLECEGEEHNTYLEIGIPVHAKLSSELLLTIFQPNTPLHDGAVIVNQLGEIVSAGVLLPLSENPKLSWEYGTRHRAAVGLTEISDSVCLVVSEETGRISLAKKGHLQVVSDMVTLQESLEQTLGVDIDRRTDSERQQFVSSLFSTSLFQKIFSR